MKQVISIALLFIVMVGCKKEGCTDSTADNYDKKAKKDDQSCEYTTAYRTDMLRTIGNEIIIPRYQHWNNQVTQLETDFNTFKSTPNTAMLQALKQSHKNAWVAWQQCSVFEFGPAENVSLRASINTYPTDTTGIENNITNGNYDLTSFLNIDRKGFPALDYLFKYSDPAVLGSNTDRLQYVEDVIQDIKTNSNSVYNAWISTDGNYIESFVNANGTDVSSSLSLLVNQFNYDYELLKNAKLGIPLGKPLTTPMPEMAESYYGGYSATLAKERLVTLFELYKGVDQNSVDQISFNDYIVYLGNNSLSNDIVTQFEVAIEALNEVNDPLTDALKNNYSVVDAAYEEIQKLVTYIKTDMATEMEVSITYQDGDGD